MNTNDIKNLNKEFKGDNLNIPLGENNISYVYDRYMDLNSQAKTWRRLSLVFAIISLISIGAFIYKNFEKQYIPYVVNINSNGDVKGTVLTSNASTINLSEREYEYFLTNIILKLRTIPVDQNFYIARLDETYPYLSKNAKNKFQEFINQETNTNAVLSAKYSVKSTIETFIKYADNKYQITWTEETFDLVGQITYKVKYTAILDITHIDVKTVEQIRTNPLGLLIKDIEIKKVGV